MADSTAASGETLNLPVDGMQASMDLQQAHGVRLVGTGRPHDVGRGSGSRSFASAKARPRLSRSPQRWEGYFWENLSPDLRWDECWTWHGPRLPKGYGQMGVREVPSKEAHRCAYILFKGPIPGGLVIDHLCRNKACVNPLHLEAVTNRENILRGVSFSAENARKTHCPKGHEYSEANTATTRGKRVCKACKRAYAHARYLRLGHA